MMLYLPWWDISCPISLDSIKRTYDPLFPDLFRSRCLQERDPAQRTTAILLRHHLLFRSIWKHFRQPFPLPYQLSYLNWTLGVREVKPKTQMIARDTKKGVLIKTSWTRNRHSSMAQGVSFPWPDGSRESNQSLKYVAVRSLIESSLLPAPS